MIGAAHALAGDARFAFARRAITRRAAEEDHESLSEAAFRARQAQGDFALSWQAHGLSYGIPRAALAPLDRGALVIANVSRGVVAEAEARFAVTVIEITAPVALRAARLAARGREDEAAIAARLARGAPAAVLPPGRLTIVNDGSVAEGVARLLAALHSLAANAPCRPDLVPGG